MKKYSIFLLCLTFLLLCLSCAATNTKKSDNQYYFKGLEYLSKGNLSLAEKNFKKGLQSSNVLSKELCAEHLFELQSSSNRIKTIEKALKKTPNSEKLQSLLCKALYANNDFEGLLALYPTEPISENNEITEYVLLTLLKMNRKDIETVLTPWFMNNPLSSFHLDFTNQPLFINACNNNIISETLQKQINFRSLVYQKKYTEASKVIDFTKLDTTQLISDAGKAVLYGSQNPGESASAFASYTNYYGYFYAARCYDKASVFSASLENFLLAMENAPSVETYDNALWYYLTTLKKVSLDKVLSALKKYAPTWTDREWFDDLFDQLSMELLTRQYYESYYDLYTLLLEYGSEYTLSKYGYIVGRLFETGLLEIAEVNSNDGAIKAFETVLNQIHGKTYYHLLSAERLNIDFNTLFFQWQQNKTKNSIISNLEAEALAQDYVENEYYLEGYSLFYNYRKNFSLDAGTKLSKTFAESSKSMTENWYPQAARVASFTIGNNITLADKTQISFVYPQYYKELITQTCEEFNLSEYILYGLIRTESFFDHDVFSVANAKGLTQLMDSTASDVARKLKINEYDVFDPSTNIRFGAFYLAELIRRLDNSVILALLSYNGGITRVRRWVSQNPELPHDLLLEVIPFEETREYGKKVLSAAAMYGGLYYEKNTHDIVREIIFQ
jgi:soluble lytic murein transglycosylase